MMVRGLALLTGLGMLLVPDATAQLPVPHRPIRFVRSRVEPQLPQSSVYAMLEDRRGFLWFGTREGIGRWDGYTMHTWKRQPFDSASLPDNIVRRLMEDASGHIYVVTVPDDVRAPNLSRLRAPAYVEVEALGTGALIPFADTDGRAWIAGADSIYSVDGVAPGRARALPGTAPLDAQTDRSGRIWVSLEDGRLERHDDHRAEPVVLGEAFPTPLTPHQGRIFEDAAGTIWVTGRGVRRIERGGTRVVRMPTAMHRLDTLPTGDMVQDGDGWLWVATDDGVYRFDPALTHLERHSMWLPGGMATQNFVVSLLHDRAGAIWAGTVWGLHRHHLGSESFVVLAHDPNQSATLGSGLVVSVLEDTIGAVWVGTLGGGLNRVLPHNGRVERFATDWAGRDNTWIWSLADAGGGRVWAGTERGLALVDPAARVPMQPVALAPPVPEDARAISALFPDGDGGLWIGREGTLLHRSIAGELTTVPLDVPGLIHTLRTDAGMLWVGTTSGLARVDPVDHSAVWYRHVREDLASLRDDLVISLHAGEDAALWVGTQSGLTRLDRRTGTFQHYPEDPAAGDAVIHSILPGPRGDLWLGTNRGLVHFDPSAPAGRRARRHDAGNGTGNIEFNRNAAWLGRDGTAYFGGDLGLTLFRPEELRENSYVPPIVLTMVQHARRHGRTADHFPPDGVPVTVRPGDYTLTFTYAALDYTDPGRNEYSHQLEGFDPTWSVPSTSRTASYTNLPPGRYLLRVRGTNSDGYWNETGLSVPVVVVPAVWETLWFRGGMVALVLLLVSGGTAALQHLRHRRTLEALAYRQALQDERARISRDMHDEVGAGITEIALLSEVALRSPVPPAGSPPPMQTVAERARGLIATLGEIIWAITPEHDAIEHLGPYLREYAGNFLEHAGLAARVHVDLAAWRGAVHADFRRNLLLILKEGLANAARHADARSMRVSAVATATTLVLEIEDDGRGFSVHPPAAPEPHHGLRNMHRRAAAMGGVLTIRSAPTEGTLVRLQVSAAEEIPA
jgi:signal transduction histidine kinase/ligand-binding sensor domain-containing protein